MKNMLIILILFSTQILNAQKVKTFFEIGLNHGHVKEKVFYESEGNTNYYKPGIGLNVGLKLVTKIDDKFDFKTGLYLSNYNYKVENYFTFQSSQQVNYRSANYIYINLPILLSCKINKNVAINLGSGINVNYATLLGDDRPFFKNKYDVPLSIGFTLRVKRATFDILYSMGNKPFEIIHNDSWEYNPSNKQYSTFFHRQLSINIGRCLNRKSKTKWD